MLSIVCFGCLPLYRDFYPGVKGEGPGNDFVLDLSCVVFGDHRMTCEQMLCAENSPV